MDRNEQKDTSRDEREDHRKLEADLRKGIEAIERLAVCPDEKVI